MALSKKTVNKHNLKRAEVFKANGLCDLDIAFAHPNFDGYGAAECILCGKTNLKWMFSIKFDAPDALTALGKITTEITRTEEVTLAVVGSKCIKDWLDAVPESVAKLEALKRWDKEMKKANKAKAKKAVEAKLKKYGFDDQAALSVALYEVLSHANAGKKLTWYLRKKLSKYARSAKWNRIKSAGTVKTAVDFMNEALAKLNENSLSAPTTPKDPDNGAAPAQAVEAPAPVDPNADLAHLDASVRDLLVKGRDLFKAGLVKKNLSDDHQDALIDIANKVKKYKSFVSSKQERFFKFLLSKAEGAKKPVAKKENALVAASATVLPGDATYASVSGISGARY
jgi:hypothetical protein